MNHQDYTVIRAERHRTLAFTAADARDLSRLLSASFPDIRFIDGSSLTHPARRVARDGRPPAITFRAGLDDPASHSFRIWRQPADWAPDWICHHGRTWKLRNWPRLHVDFQRSSPLPPRRLVLSEGRLHARYLPFDDAHRAFLDTVWALVERLACNRLAAAPTAPARPVPLWAGPDALAWCRADPDRRLGRAGYRPSA